MSLNTPLVLVTKAQQQQQRWNIIFADPNITKRYPTVIINIIRLSEKIDPPEQKAGRNKHKLEFRCSVKILLVLAGLAN